MMPRRSFAEALLLGFHDYINDLPPTSPVRKILFFDEVIFCIGCFLNGGFGDIKIFAHGIDINMFQGDG